MQDHDKLIGYILIAFVIFITSVTAITVLERRDTALLKRASAALDDAYKIGYQECLNAQK